MLAYKFRFPAHALMLWNVAFFVSACRSDYYRLAISFGRFQHRSSTRLFSIFVCVCAVYAPCLSSSSVCPFGKNQCLPIKNSASYSPFAFLAANSTAFPIRVYILHFFTSPFGVHSSATATAAACIMLFNVSMLSVGCFRFGSMNAHSLLWLKQFKHLQLYVYTCIVRLCFRKNFFRLTPILFLRFFIFPIV